MNPEQIRQLVQDELHKQQVTGRYNFQNIPHHTHNSTDSLPIKQSDVVPAGAISGAITFSEDKQYKLYLNAAFTPSQIMMYGNVIGNSGQKFFITGSAQLQPSFYFQPNNNNSVTTGGPQYPFVEPAHPEYGTNIPMQSGAYYGQESAGGAFHTLTSGFHIIDVEYPVGTLYARMTVTNFSKSEITLEVETLATGWTINANFIVQ